MVLLPPEDPFDWSVDDVVAIFCDSKTSWSTSTAAAVQPDPIILGKALRENRVNGSTLLTAVDHGALRDCLGLRALGECATILHAVGRLRVKSKKYQQYLQEYAAYTPLPYPTSQAPGSLHSTQGYSPFPLGHTTSLANDYCQSPSKSSSHNYNQENPANCIRRDSEPGIAAQSIDAKRACSPDDPTTTVVTPVIEGQLANQTPEGRRGETFIIDSSGRKRRKLTLMPSDIPKVEQTEDQLIRSADPGSHCDGSTNINETCNEATAPVSDLPQSTEYAQQQQRDKMERSNGPLPKYARKSLKRSPYLGYKALPIDFIFYGDTVAGEELRNDTKHELIEGETGVEERWKFRSDPHIPDGQRLYVNNLFRNFLQGISRTCLKRAEKRYIGLGPYSKRIQMAEKYQSRSFTLITADATLATRENVLDWPEISDPHGHGHEHPNLDKDIEYSGSNIPESKAFILANNAASNDQWDFLEKWHYMEDDKIEPAYGDSGSENEYDLDTWQQMQDENGTIERPSSSKGTKRPLSQELISEVIDKSIEALVMKWKGKELPKWELKANSIWRRSRRDKTKQTEIDRAKAHIEHINSGPLAKMRKEILAEVWTNQNGLKRACAILEQTIFNREEMSWRILLLRGKVEPPRRAPKHKKSRSLKMDAEVEAEGELLTTDSESEGLDDFIDEVEEEFSDEQGTEDVALAFADADEEEVSMDISGDDSSDNEIIAPSERRASKAETIIEEEDGEVESVAPTNWHDALSSTAVTQSFTAMDSSDTVHASSPPSLSIPKAGCELPLTPKAEPSPSPRGSRSTKPIDLTLSSDIFDVPKAEMPKNRLESLAFIDLGSTSSDDSFNQDDLGDDVYTTLPSYDDISAISKLSWRTIEHELDRKRLLIKLVNQMSFEQRMFLVRLTATSRFEGMHCDVWDALKAMRSGRVRLVGSDEVASKHMMSTASLFLMWNQCKRASPSEGFSKTTINQILNDYNAINDSFKPFFSFLCRAMKRYDENGMEIKLEVALDDLVRPNIFEKVASTPTNSAPHKTRKYTVPEDVAARDIRTNDRLRIKAQEARRQKLQRQMPQLAANSDADLIPVNTSKFDDEDFVLLNSHIGQRIKPHQIEGVQFMWRELVTDQRSLQGCLLAHSMGLGKTMQAITLLVTLAEAAKSSNNRISKQIPNRLKESRTLIICPPSLLDNWLDEFLIWAPGPCKDTIGQLRKVDSSSPITTRVDEISAWYSQGGVLLISYEMLKLLLNNKGTKSRGPSLSEHQHGEVKKHLLEGPNIIIADEAHTMKNPRAAITIAASQFKSKSRIALTGSPLTNNLEEYYTMINWIAKGYLGDSVEFRATYVEPIQEGLYIDSTDEEQRKSLVMLQVLKEELDPKINRADITVLKGDLKPKTEFLIKVPLTNLQEDAYRLYVRTVMKGKTDFDINMARLWQWLDVLSLLNNHPMCFKNKLIEREERTKPQKGAKAAVVANEVVTDVASVSDEEVSELTPADTPISEMGLPKTLIDQEMELLASIDGPLESMIYSHKVQILNQILDLATEVGDKALVFSQKIPTLDFLESLMKTARRRYSRLDGKTKMADRQKATKAFNTNGVDIYLVSTRAGGLGLNLTGANRVVIFDFGFNPAWEEQAVGRAYRIGQTKPVYVYRFLSGGTFEEIIHNKAVYKTQLASRVVDKKNPMRSAIKKARDYLFEPKAVKQDDLSEIMGKDPSVLDCILAKQDGNHSIRSIQLTELFQREANEKLTAEEEAKKKEWIQGQQLRRTNPDAYNKMVMARQKANGIAPVENRDTVGLQPITGGHTKVMDITPPTPKVGDLSSKPPIPGDSPLGSSRCLLS